MRAVRLILALALAGCASRAQLAPPKAEAEHAPPAAAAAPAAAVPPELADIPRAQRRAYDGGPPVIPHDPVEGSCLTCHDGTAAPAFPHGRTAGMSEESRCVQCHVYRTTDAVFAASTFQGFPQDVRRKGERRTPKGPPKRAHRAFMRENCLACHAGDAGRPEIRCGHPDRPKCASCHPAGEED